MWTRLRFQFYKLKIQTGEWVNWEMNNENLMICSLIEYDKSN